MPVEPLFQQGGALRHALAEQQRKLLAEVDAAPEDHLLHVDEEAWVTALVDRWRVDIPEIHADQMWMDPARETKVDVSRDQMRFIVDRNRPAWYPGYRVVIHVPVTGDVGVLTLQASQFSLNPPWAEVGKGELLDIVEYPHDSPVDIKTRAEALVQKVDQHLSWSRLDIEQFNRELNQVARAGISLRKERIRRHYEHLKETGLPIGQPETSSKTYIADAIVRRPAPKLPTIPDSRPMALEPVLADDVYEHILRIIRSVGRDMERSPLAYAGMSEESRRQTILMALNTHYRGQTTAEAFNFTGKTDLLVRHEGQNLFVGECKYWSGTKELLAAVDQLFGYRVWRDTKLALIVFVRQRDLTSIINKARDALETHPEFVRWQVAETQTELRSIVSWPGDNQRRGDLTIFLVHVPSSTGFKAE